MTYRVCFVCSGNICRSPMAERVFARLVDDAGLADSIAVDSAGTGAWHAGAEADPRAVAALSTAGYDGRGHVARQFRRSWFDDHDLVVALDHGHLDDLRLLAPDAEAAARVVLLRTYDPEAVAAELLDVVDPYYDGESGFADRLAEIERACRGLLDAVRRELSDAGR